MDCEISHRLERGMSASENIRYKVVETSPYQTRFKNLEGSERGCPKRTIHASSGIGLL